MIKKMNQTGNTALFIPVVIVGLIIGFAAAKVMDNNKNKNTSASSNSVSAPDSGTKAADLRANLVNLGVAHQDLTMHAIDAALDGSPNAAQVKADLIANGQSISAAVGSVYGQGAQDKFQALWNLHLGDFVNYAVADKTGDEAAKTAALNDIATNYTKPLAQLLSGANPNLPEATLESALGDHVTMTAQMIDYHVQGKYTEEDQMRAQGATHLEGLFSTLAGGIVKQFPGKF